MHSPDYEVVKRGLKFLLGNVCIFVYQIFKVCFLSSGRKWLRFQRKNIFFLVSQLEKSFDFETETLLPTLIQHCLLEITGVSTQDRASEMGAEIQAFANHLVGLVDIVNVDHKKLQRF